jgi:quercetin 2,3-dioxygenase
MKNERKIETILDPPPFRWVGNGFKVHNFLPQAILSNTRMSPFFLLDYNAKMYYPPSIEKRGVGVHPHRGLETVTIAYHGIIAHHDSAGNGGVIYQGDVQWMTAGKAILHKEYHEKRYVEKGGDFQMVQLWINLPAKDKLTAPNYQEIPQAKMGKYELENKKGIVKVIAGQYKTAKGTAKTFTPIHLYDVILEKSAIIDFRFPEHYNTAILLISGKVQVYNSQSVLGDQFVLFENKGTDFVLEASEKSKILVMSGEPINEPVFPYGPFLMNTKAEIEQAFEDYHNGFFGYLEE